MTRVLALDLGTSSVRARVYDENAAPVGGAEPQVPYEPKSGLADAGELLDASRGVVDQALGAAGPVDAIGCSAFWHSLLVLDERERPLTPVLTWRDLRSASYAEELRARLDPAAVHARTGCVLHPSYWPAKLAWLRGEEPGVFRRARRFVSFPDYLLLRLTGELRVSLSQASATGLYGRSGWDEELLEVLDVEPEQLSPVSDEQVGGWFPPLGDGACSNVGAGCVTPDRAALMVGTSGALRVVRPDDGRPVRAGLFLYRLDEERVVEGGSLSDGGNLHAWLERTLRLPGDARVADREPDGHGLTFLTLLGGERSPGWHPSAKGAIAGLTFETQPLDLLQAALEGVAYRFAEIADLLPEVREVVATGAALDANPEWTQILADVLGRPVFRGVAEGSSRGAAVVALERLGVEPPA
ncbi:MAG: gluconokinase, partial [Actinobacteria bacterium]|nr:gluconokinase [Actinomycetota bacterium]